MRQWMVLVLGLALVAGTGCDRGDDDDDDTAVELPDEICNEPPDRGDGPWFTNVTDDLGLGPDGLDIQGGLVNTADFDGDRWPDLFLSQASSGERDDPADPDHHVRLLRNVGGTSFEDITFSSGFTDTRDGGQGRDTQFAIFGDVDNDGDTDAFAATFIGYDTVDVGDVTEILLNDGAGNFSLGPENVFTDSADYDAVVAAAMLDHDHDGNLDVFVGHHYARYGYITSCGQDSLFAGDGAGNFTDITEAVGMGTVSSQTTADYLDGINHRPTWGVSVCDIDGDGWADVLSDAYGRQFNMLFHANGDGTYTDIARDVGFASDDNEDYSDNWMYGQPEYWNDGWDDQPFRNGGNTAATVCGDLDNDGDLDLLQVELRHEWAGQSSDMTELLYNDGVGDGGAFERPGRETTGFERDHDVPWNESWNEGDLGGALLDFDNDGQLDVIVTSSDYPYTWSLFWRQLDEGTFREDTEASGLKVDRAHGITLIDYDRDGDHDVVLGTSRMRWEDDDDPPDPGAAYVHVFRNDLGHGGNKLMIDLEGAAGSNRDAVGARIIVKAGGDTFVREVISGHGIQGQQNDYLEIIGVGDHCTVDSVEIRWPDAAQTVTTLQSVRANYVLLIHPEDGLQYLTMDEYLGG